MSSPSFGGEAVSHKLYKVRNSEYTRLFPASERPDSPMRDHRQSPATDAVEQISRHDTHPFVYRGFNRSQRALTMQIKYPKEPSNQQNKPTEENKRKASAEVRVDERIGSS